MAAALILGLAQRAAAEPAGPSPVVPETRPAVRVPFPAIRDWNSLAITLERHPCPLVCPAYRVTVHGDGRVEYEGRSGVALKGVHRAAIAPFRVRRLFELFRQANFF